ncbi:hypothetical protein DMR_30220 [Solidesulfovibrio magneticus RS-1]|uniref:Uncharacterized protein n=1 Tax=Solidesulfovibrio magneticus (strain ATCC 700980 / DSM 13731 / RS-1) TaxID=573370 RepID=C4XID8_SOLM1|nr:hypothetical protein DMR_30220 [Solidesulfovibrio magneticus RS-1]
MAWRSISDCHATPWTKQPGRAMHMESAVSFGQLKKNNHETSSLSIIRIKKLPVSRQPERYIEIQT